MYTVLFDELVLKKDFKAIDPADRKRIVRAVRDKLTRDPEHFGDPLRRGLAGLWKLRVGKYRVVYEIEEEQVTVYVLKVGFRRDKEVYVETLKRLKELSEG